MKALDTPVLLELLRGRSGIERLVASLQSEELATTELNLFELDSIARAGPAHGRERRRSAVDRLRRKITVLPVDARSVQAAASLSAGRLREATASQWLMLGTALANGCSEWITTSAGRVPRNLGKLQVKVIGR